MRRTPRRPRADSRRGRGADRIGRPGSAVPRPGEGVAPAAREGARPRQEVRPEMSSASLKFFRMETDSRGITVVTFDRPPVNAISFDVYPEIRQLSETIE